MALVLLAEDTADNREIYRTILNWAGHAVVQAENGAEALASIQQRHPDLIVMDVTMPVMDGLDVTRRLKADPGTAPIPILILTAHAYESDRKEAEEAGADAFLTKPCVPKDLLAEVERLLGQAQQSPRG